MVWISVCTKTDYRIKGNINTCSSSSKVQVNTCVYIQGISSIIQEANMKLIEYSNGACFLCINHFGPFWMQTCNKKERDGMVFEGYQKVLVDTNWVEVVT